MNADLQGVIEAVGPDFHGLSYRERLIVGAVLKHLSTPPADDVREALVGVILNACASPDAVYDPEAREIADAIFAAFEVRPHGTVTEPCPVCNWTGPSPQYDIDGVAVHHPSHEPRGTVTK